MQVLSALALMCVLSHWGRGGARTRGQNPRGLTHIHTPGLFLLPAVGSVCPCLRVRGSCGDVG